LADIQPCSGVVMATLSLMTCPAAAEGAAAELGLGAGAADEVGAGAEVCAGAWAVVGEGDAHPLRTVPATKMRTTRTSRLFFMFAFLQLSKNENDIAETEVYTILQRDRGGVNLTLTLVSRLEKSVN
jgi:hypothetical protein